MPHNQPAADLAWHALFDVQFAHLNDLDRWAYPHPAQRIAPWILQRAGVPGCYADAEHKAAEILGISPDSDILDRGTFHATEDAVIAEFGPQPDMSGYRPSAAHDDDDILECPTCQSILARYGSSTAGAAWAVGPLAGGLLAGRA